jgi:hypothetical protein
MKTKVLFVIKSIAHYSYVSSIIEVLDRSCEVELLFNKKWSWRSKKRLGEWTVERTSNRWIFPLRELRSYLSYKKLKNQSPYYEQRWKGYVPKWLRVPLPDKVLAFIEKCVPSDRGIVKDLRRRNPDVVVVTPINHRFSEEVDYVKAAKSLGIPTVTTAISWDSLTTKGIFHVIPDLTLVWNEEQRREAKEIHGVENVAITGAPFFDKWFDTNNLFEDRDSFCKRVGIESPYFLYLGSSKNIAEDESWLAQKLCDASKISMLARPHPANTEPFKKLRNAVVMDGVLPEGLDEQRDFYNAVKHSEYVIGVNTSGMIDALVLDKVCYSVGAGVYDSTQSETIHFRQIFPYLGEHGSRGEFIRKFIRPRGLGLLAGEIAAKKIKLCCHTM